MRDSIAGCILAWLLFTSPAFCADDAQALDQFLNRLGLTDLRLAHMERTLARQTTSANRPELVRRLADAYAEELIAAADDSERFAVLRARVEKLLASAPEARTASIDVLLLQAEYQRAETLIIHWTEKPGDTAARNAAREILAHIQPLLAARQRELAAATEEASERIDNLKTEQQRAAAEQQLKRQQTVAVRADYFAGWSAYYLGVARDDAERAQADYLMAQKHFCRVLDVANDKDYADVDSEGLGLDSIWRSRTVIGLGLAELGLAHMAAAKRVFGWLGHASVPPAVRDQAPYWHVQGMLNAGRWKEAAQLVEREVKSFTGNPSAGKSSLCIAAIRAGAAGKNARDERARLVEEGIRGLARMRQFDTLDKLIEEYQLKEADGVGDFQLAWLRGRREYLTAEKQKQDEGFRAAASTLAAALALPAARLDFLEAGQARYYLAWARYRLNEFDSAGRLFLEAATALRAAVPEVAMQAGWMHATCLVQLAAKDKRQAAAAMTALQAFKQDYPASEEAARADVLISRLRQAHAAPEDAIRELAAIPPGDKSYVSAQYELSQLRYQLWAKSKADLARSAPLAADVVSTADRYLALSDKSVDGERRLKTALLAVAVLQAAASPDLGRENSLLAAVSGAAANLDPQNIAVIEYQYRRLALAQKTDDAETVRQAAEHIARHGGGTPYELPALVAVARAADQAVAAAPPAARHEKIVAAANVYARLVALLGDSPETLAANKNALAAASKLAQYDEEQEAWPRAAQRLDRLVEALPRDRRLLKRAGMAWYKAGGYSQALIHWRSLLGGLESGSDDWLEAKYYQVACLIKTDRPAAEKVLKQFLVLYPEMKSAAWRQKFSQLEAELH